MALRCKVPRLVAFDAKGKQVELSTWRDDEVLTYQRSEDEVRESPTMRPLKRIGPGRYQRADGSVLVCLDASAP